MALSVTVGTLANRLTKLLLKNGLLLSKHQDVIGVSMPMGKAMLEMDPVLFE